jgi:hypothetical protein
MVEAPPIPHNPPRAFNHARRPRCFYEDVVSGIKRPGGPPFTLNNAVVRIAPGDAVCGATLWTHHFFQSVTTIFGKAPPLPGLLRNCSSFFS